MIFGDKTIYAVVARIGDNAALVKVNDKVFVTDDDRIAQALADVCEQRYDGATVAMLKMKDLEAPDAT